MNWVQAGFTWVRLRKIDRITEVVPLKKETGGGVMCFLPGNNQFSLLSTCAKIKPNF